MPYHNFSKTILKQKISNCHFNCKKKWRFFQTIVSLFSLLIFNSCNTPVEKQEAFSFQTRMRPDINGVRNIMEIVNEGFLNNVIKANSDSVLQFQSTQKETSPVYKDIAFLPIASATELKDLLKEKMEYSGNNEDFTAQIAIIDFTKNFVLVLGHPSSSPTSLSDINTIKAIYFDEVLDEGIKNNKREIKLNSKRLGNASVGYQSIMELWKSKVYILQRNNCDSVNIEIDKKKYAFTINNK